MCGIAGAVNFDADDRPIDDTVIARLNEWQRRRGPDGAGLWSSSDHSVVLGHRRLSIIDTSSGGAQPMSDSTGRWTITFNGEIYKSAKKSAHRYRLLRMSMAQGGCRRSRALPTRAITA
ncbi:MAG TPA: hypothetical protein VNF99_12745 [Stellaceae bacterium]|nr:hypothetical protein [Stellaceae bacterium]